jgi:hypothetical protein
MNTFIQYAHLKLMQSVNVWQNNQLPSLPSSERHGLQASNFNAFPGLTH